MPKKGTREEVNAYHREWRAKNKEKRKEHNDRWYIKKFGSLKNPKRTEYFRNKHYEKKYGITADDFELMIAEQHNQCAICDNEFGWTDDRKSRASLDHDHNLKKGDPGFIRGIICNSCNLALGHFNDNIKRIKRAVQYLEENKLDN